MGTKTKEQKDEEHYEKAREAGMRVEHVFNNTTLPDSFMKPPGQKLNFVTGMKHVFKRLQDLGMSFGRKLPDLRDGNCLFNGK